MVKLHPNALPKKEAEARDRYDSLYDLCVAIVRSGGWDRVFQVRKIPSTQLVQITYQPAEKYLSDPPVVLTESEGDFQEGDITRFYVKQVCADFIKSIK